MSIKTYTFRVKDKIDLDKIENDYKNYASKDLSKNDYFCDCILSYINNKEKNEQIDKILTAIKIMFDKLFYIIKQQKLMFELIGCNNEILKSMLSNNELEDNIDNGLFDNIPKRFEQRLKLDT